MKPLIWLVFFLGIFANSIAQKSDSGVRDWLSKLNITIPSIRTEGFQIDNLLIDNIILGGIESSWIITEGKKTGFTLSTSEVGLHANGRFQYSKLSVDGILDIEAKKVAITFPMNIQKNPETGLIKRISTSGLAINLDKDQLELSFTGDTITDFIIRLLIPIIKNYLLDSVSEIICSTASKSLDEKLTEAFGKINNILMNSPRPIPLNTSIENPVDLSRVSILDAVRFLLSKFTGADGPLSFNKIVNILSNNTGEIKIKDFTDEPIRFDFNVSNTDGSQLAALSIGILDLNISDLNTWGNFTALVPNETDSKALDTFTYLENLGINLSFFINVSCPQEGIFTSDVNLYETADIITKLANNSLWTQIQLPVYPNRLKNYSHKQCLNLGCILDLFDENATGINSLALNMNFAYIVLKASTGDLEDDIQKVFNDVVSLFVDEYKDKIPLFVDAILNSTGIDFVNQLIANYLIENECENIKDEQKLELNYIITFSAIFGAVILYLLFFGLPLLKGKNDKAISKPKEIDEEVSGDNIMQSEGIRISYLCECTCAEKGKFKWLKEFARTDPAGASLFLNPKVSLFWRLSIPLLILLTIAIFISSNTGTGASVYILFSIGRRVEVPSLFDFGLGNSVKDMWKAGVYPLSILILFFSGIWPYLKLILMLITWITPSSILSKGKRESALMFLDATGKWSILDSYVMTLMLVAFHFDIGFPIIGEKIDSQTKVEVLVNAAYGFLTLLACTCVSLALSHIIIHLHRRIDAFPDENKGEEAEQFKSLISYTEEKYCFGKLTQQIFITILLFSTLILVIVGENIISFSFYFNGLAGYALGLLDIDQQREYSVINLGIEVPTASEEPNSFTIRFTQVIFFLTTCVLPITHLLVLFIIWLVPLSRAIQKYLYSICETLNAWSCLDVFVVSIIASILGIRQFTEFIIGDKCDSINPFIEKYFTDTLDGHTSCFEVQTKLQSGCWILFAAAIMYFIGSMIVMKECREALIKRLPKHIRETLYGNAINDIEMSRSSTQQRSTGFSERSKDNLGTNSSNESENESNNSPNDKEVNLLS